MSLTPTKRRFLMVAAVMTGAAFTLGLLARQALTGVVVSTLLQLAGASEIKFTISHASPWSVVVEDIGFQVRTQGFSARKVTFTRAHWWSPSLGTVKVEQAKVPLTIDGSDTNPVNWPTYKNGVVRVAPTQLPVEDITVDGQLVIKAAALPDQALNVKLEARIKDGFVWDGTVTADGPGLGVQGEGRYDPIKDELRFKLSGVNLDLQRWQDFMKRLVVLPGGNWDMTGKVSGNAEGRWAGKDFVASGTVHLREGHLVNSEKSIVAQGIEADLEFSDLDHLISKPGSLRAREVKTGQLVLSNLEAVIACAGPNQISVSSLSLQALGGTVSTEKFNYFINQRELEVVVLAEGIDVEQVMALTSDLHAKATGHVNGRFPLRIDDTGLRLGTGWLELKPGVYAELQLNANGLLTRGTPASGPTYAVMKKIEDGLLKLKVSELRLDIRPPNAPPGRSAQLHLKGEPVDPDVKAPVILDLNVNGPLEKLINLGLDSRVSFGSKP